VIVIVAGDIRYHTVSGLIGACIVGTQTLNCIANNIGTFGTIDWVRNTADGRITIAEIAWVMSWIAFDWDILATNCIVTDILSARIPIITGNIHKLAWNAIFAYIGLA